MRHKITLIVILVLLCTNCHNKANNADWRFIGESKGGSVYYYDQKGINHPTEGVITVWVKEVPSESENIYTTIKLLMQLRGGPIPEDIKKCERYTYSLILYEVTCSDQTIIPISSQDYDNEGRVLYSCTNEKEAVRDVMEFAEFDITIVPETIWDVLYKAVCQ